MTDNASPLVRLGKKKVSLSRFGFLSRFAEFTADFLPKVQISHILQGFPPKVWVLLMFCKGFAHFSFSR